MKYAESEGFEDVVGYTTNVESEANQIQRFRQKRGA